MKKKNLKKGHESVRGSKWYNNGKVNKRFSSNPDRNVWKRGRLKIDRFRFQPNKNEIKDLYLNKNYTLKQLSRYYSVSESTIIKFLNKHNIC